MGQAAISRHFQHHPHLEAPAPHQLQKVRTGMNQPESAYPIPPSTTNPSDVRACGVLGAEKGSGDIKGSQTAMDPAFQIRGNVTKA